MGVSGHTRVRFGKHYAYHCDDCGAHVIDGNCADIVHHANCHPDNTDWEQLNKELEAFERDRRTYKWFPAEGSEQMVSCLHCGGYVINGTERDIRHFSTCGEYKMPRTSGQENLDKEFKMIVVRSTEKAVLVTSEKDPLNKHWLPRSQITMLDHKGDKIVWVEEGDKITVQIPAWLAERREILA